ncbi:thioredoxin-disulfide reductase [Clostridium cellulovorans]|uniref:Thioredoxin reductase n=1 Tax=Clostridium cellulovorans (strain ATCC 35296 / DSM 3052 / OCM 3 / 743B) TaxID=573061 RepID=D9SKD0_CLOC7|nr:thioredoxin-disulfide reductase [Clostridium cellulovorans]ADL51426.1 Thioredoxin-disulfide reductase [Clostridium cellulovorans 743B]
MDEQNKLLREIDVFIIGSGPAGLTAGIYAARANLDVVVFEDMVSGGQIRQTYTVENYPGHLSIDGNDLADKMLEQAKGLGAKIEEYDSIISIKITDIDKVIETYKYIYKPKVVIIATGAEPKKLPVEEEEKYAGRGIHYCAVCDGGFYRNKSIAVVGGGNTALEEAIYLSRFGNVKIIRRKDYFNGERVNLNEVNRNPNIEIIWNSDVKKVCGEDFVEYVVLEDTVTKKNRKISIDGIFVAIGVTPKTEIFRDFVNVNESGYIIANEATMETNIKGVYAAGDVREKLFRQITTAVSDGTIAALMAEKYIQGLKKA